MRLRFFLFWGIAVAMAGCTSAPLYRTPTQEPEPHRTDGGEVVRAARKYLGAPYRMGGTTESGMDCSGLVVTVFKEFGIAVPRTSRAQAHFGAPVERGHLRPGDLVFFRTGKGGAISHVGIYAGRGEFIHASTRARRVKFDRLDNKYFKKRFATARRVL